MIHTIPGTEIQIELPDNASEDEINSAYDQVLKKEHSRRELQFKPNPAVQQSSVDGSSMLKEAGTSVAVGAGLGATFGGVPGAFLGAVSGLTAFGTGKLLRWVASSAGLSEGWQLGAEIAGGLAGGGAGSMARVPSILAKTTLPAIATKSVKAAGAALGAGYIGGSVSKDPENDFSYAWAGAAMIGSYFASNNADRILNVMRSVGKATEGKLLQGLSFIDDSGKLVTTVDDVAKQAQEFAWEQSGKLYKMQKLLAEHGVKPESSIGERLAKVSFGLDDFRSLPVEEQSILQEWMRVHVDHGQLLQQMGGIEPGVRSMLSYINKATGQFRAYIPTLTKKRQRIGFKSIIAGPDPATLYGPSLMERGKVLQMKKGTVLDPKNWTVGQKYVDKRGNEWIIRARETAKGKQVKYAWRDWTPQERAAMGDKYIYDFGVSFAKYKHDNMRIMRDIFFYDRLSRTNLVSAVEQPGFVQVTRAKIPNSDVYQFGRLAGQYVPPQVDKMLRNYGRIVNGSDSEALRAAGKLHGIWKKTFLGLNGKSYANAVIGNTMLSSMHGHNPLRLIHLGLQAMRNEAKYGETLLKHGITPDRGMFDMAKSFKMARHYDLKNASPAGQFIEAMNGLGDAPIAAYGKIDQIFKAGLFRKLTEELGVDAKVAAQAARDTFVSYELLPGGVQTLRDTVIPFISFFYRVFPRLAQVSVTNPERALAIMGAVEALQQAGYKTTYEKNWKAGREFENEIGPTWRNVRPGGILADYVRLPGNKYITTAWAPWNMPLSMPTREEQGLAPMMILQSPLLRFMVGFFSGHDPSTGQPLESMGGTTEAGNALRYMHKVAGPSLPIINKYTGDLIAREGIFDPLVAWFNLYGTEPDGDPVNTYEILWNQVLPSVKEINPRYEERLAKKRIDVALGEKVGIYASAKRRKAAAPTTARRKGEVKEAVTEAKDKMRRINELKQEAGMKPAPEVPSKLQDILFIK